MPGTRFIFGFNSLQDLLGTVAGNLILTKGYVTWLLGALGTVGIWLVGDWRMALLLMIMMVIDWITGCIKAIRKRVFNSWTFQRMGFNLIARFTLVSLAFWIGKVFPVIAFLSLHDALMIFFLQSELISIVENLHAIDARIVPSAIAKYLNKAVSVEALAARMLPALGTKKERLKAATAASGGVETEKTESVEDGEVD